MIRNKKIVSTVFALLMAVFFSSSALATSGVVETDLGGGAWSYEATLEDAGVVSGKYYAVVAVRGDGFTFEASDILYIEQKVASKEGAIKFANIIPKNYGGGKVYITGLNSPVYVGDLNSHGISYSGYLKYYGGELPVIKLVGDNNVEYVATVTSISDNRCSFRFDGVVSGDYKFEVSSAQYATFEEDLTIDSTATNVEKSIYKLGDVTRDGIINTADISKIIDSILLKISLDDYEKEVADVNRDGRVSMADVSRIMDYILRKITNF